jgi:hypothetical protein
MNMSEDYDDIDDRPSTWVTKDGTEIPIPELEDYHLMNIIRLLERQHAYTIAAYVYGPEPRGDMAKDAFEREFDTLDEEGPSAIDTRYDELTEEADGRRLDNREARMNRQLALGLAVIRRSRKGG